MASAPKEGSREVHQILDSRGTRTYQVGVLLGLSAGVLLIFVGVGLCVAGLNGSIEWILTAKGWGSRLANASPGVFFSLLGFFIVVWYKPKYQFRFSANTQRTRGHSAGPTPPTQTTSK